MIDVIYWIVLVLNTAWFGAGFWYFTFRRVTAAKLFVPRSARSSPIFTTLAAAIPFLGGMNLAFSLLSALLLLCHEQFTAPGERAVLLFVIGTAHLTQFAVNVPIARQGGRQGEAYWNVVGPMRFIFVVDAAMAAVNLAVCVVILVSAGSWNAAAAGQESDRRSEITGLGAVSILRRVQSVADR